MSGKNIATLLFVLAIIFSIVGIVIGASITNPYVVVGGLISGVYSSVMLFMIRMGYFGE